MNEVEELKKALDRVTDPGEYERVQKKLQEAERDAKLHSNRLRLEQEARERAAFEAERQKYLDARAEFEQLTAGLETGEDAIFQKAVEFAQAARERSDQYARVRALAKHINHLTEKFGGSQVSVSEIRLYSAKDLTWQEYIRGVINQVIDLMRWNEAHPESAKPLTPKYLTRHSNTWGSRD
jgi:chromosome segregation ATPase